MLIFTLCWFPLHLSRLLKKTIYKSHDAHRCELLKYVSKQTCWQKYANYCCSIYCIFCLLWCIFNVIYCYISFCCLLLFLYSLMPHALCLLLQFPIGVWLLQFKHGNDQLLHQPHNPLLCLQEVQKLLQGKITILLVFVVWCMSFGAGGYSCEASCWVNVNSQQGHSVIGHET